MPRLRSLSAAERKALLARLAKRRGAAGRVAPLSYAQQRLWFLEQLAAGNPFYNETSAVRLGFAVDPDAFRHALNEVIRRHEALRTVFEPGGGEPRQRVLAGLELDVPVLDLSSFPATHREAESARVGWEQGRLPFDLERGPLLRATLLRFDAADYVLVLTMHHIVCDGWSMRVFFEELLAFYQGCVAGRPVNLAPLAMQYADFTVWQREWLSGSVLESQIAYWRDQLAGVSPLELPTDFPRPTVPTFAGARERIAIPPRCYALLRGVGEQDRATPFMTLLAAFQTLLFRYAGQDDIVVGSPIANRNRPELEGLIGFFVNTLVLRTDFSGNPTFHELLGRVREVTLSAYAHQDVPFERLVEGLQPHRDASRNPLFQVTFQMLSATATEPGDAGRPLPPIDVELKTSKFDLQCDLWEAAGGVVGYLEYSTDLFRPETIRSMARHFENLLEGAAGSPQTRVGELSMLTPDEERALLSDWKQAAADPVPYDCVHEEFAQRARELGSRVAVGDPGSTLTYAELDHRSNQLARYLKDRGVVAGCLVAVLLDRSVDYVLATVAILKAGGAYVPLDPSYPEERLLSMIGTDVIHLVLTSERHAAKLPGFMPRLRLDADRLLWNHLGASPIPREVDGRSLAYVVFTSGSTGRPRGVEVTHSALANLAAWHNREYGVAPDDRASLFASPGFDASVWEIWPYLAAGASIWVPDEHSHASPHELAIWMAGHEITISFLPTPVAESFLEVDLPASLRLRMLLTGGDRLRRYPRRPIPFRLVNHYGPTENTVVATFADVTRGPAGETPPIGRPIANVQAYVLDRALRPVPVGVRGELYLGGQSLARGYLGDAALTRERFIANPFSRRPGSRLYRTSDLVRCRRDGMLEFLGRADRQLKVRGFRIEPGDIEAALDQHPRVRKSLVVMRARPGGEDVIAAYLIASPAGDGPGREAAADEQAERLEEWRSQQLRDFLRRRLPDYMIPTDFVWMDKLPLTPNGKLDPHALPTPPRRRTDLTGSYSPPRTGVESEVASIWSQVLGVDHIGIDTNFFDLGGHSLLLVRVHEKLKRHFRTGLSVVDLFLHSTIRDLAQAIASEQSLAGELGPDHHVRLLGNPSSSSSMRTSGDA